MTYPLVPFSTVVDSWDHHWFLWLPFHPVYEFVEVASREPDRDGRVDVWVWFTERAGSKRQIHYRNSELLAGFVGGHYRPISFQISGDHGRPRGVEVRFDDSENMPVDIEVKFDAYQTLGRQGAGLTDQSGHMRDRAFLIFYRDTNALARYGRASIGPMNYTFDREEAKGAFPFKWAYSHGISINLILYNSFTATFGPGGFSPAPGTDTDYVLNRARAWERPAGVGPGRTTQRICRSWRQWRLSSGRLRSSVAGLRPWQPSAILVVFGFHQGGRRSDQR